MTAATALVLPLVAWTLLLRRVDGESQWWSAAIRAAPFAIGSSSVAWWLLVTLSIGSSRALIAVEMSMWITAIAALCWHRARVAAPQTATTRSDCTTWIIIPILIVIGGGAVASFSAGSAANPHGEWDAWAIWNLRARFLFRLEPSRWHDAFPPLLAWSHLDYPLLLSVSVARGWTYGRAESTAVPIAIAALFAIGIVATAGISVARARSRSRGLLTAAAVLACPTFVRYASSQCADIPLAFYVLATVVLISRAVEAPTNRPTWLLAGASAGLAAWTKNEGILFFVTCIAVVAFWSIRVGGKHSLRPIGGLLAGAFPMIVAVMLLKSLTPSNDVIQATTLQSVSAAVADVDRLKTVFTAIARELWFGGATAFGVLPIVAAFTVVVGVRTPLTPGPLIGLSTAGILIAAYAVVYIVTPHDLAWHMKTSLDRVMLHTFPSLVWCAMMLAKH